MTAEKTFFSLGTMNVIKIFDADDLNIIDRAEKRVMEIDDRMSAYKEGSDVSKISANAGNGFSKVHKETFELIKKAVAFGDISMGKFDVTMRPLIELWGINKKGDYIPSGAEIEEVLQLVNYKDIMFDDLECAIALKRKGQSIDLGGIAKGYAADEVKRILHKNGIKSAMINLGGNIVVMGNRQDGNQWKIGIQNPMAATGEYLGTIEVSDRTIVTSGSNERFFIKDGIRYHHIIDPTTGRPVQNELLSATAVCSSSTDADAITTALFILGPQKSIEILNKLNIDAIFVTNNMDVMVTNGLKENFIMIYDRREDI